MLRRTTTILALALGALAAGLVVTGQSAVGSIRLADSQGTHTTSGINVGQLGTKTAVPKTVTPVKPILTAPLPGKTQRATPAKPRTAQVIKVKEISAIQARSLMGKQLITGKI